MNEKILTELFKLKMEIWNAKMEQLPDSLKAPMQQLQQTFVRAVHEATGEYLTKSQTEEPEKNLHKIPIE